VHTDISALQRKLTHIFGGFAIALIGVVGAEIVASL
jgi:hypothetical protein